jgi:hypothetical protein
MYNIQGRLKRGTVGKIILFIFFSYFVTNIIRPITNVVTIAKSKYYIFLKFITKAKAHFIPQPCYHQYRFLQDNLVKLDLHKIL